jgi:hypothetical protein
MYAEFFYLFMQYKIAVTLEESYLWPTIAVCAQLYSILYVLLLSGNASWRWLRAIRKA